MEWNPITGGRWVKKLQKNRRNRGIGDDEFKFDSTIFPCGNGRVLRIHRFQLILKGYQCWAFHTLDRFARLLHLRKVQNRVF